jgi:hypothetical protein
MPDDNPLKRILTALSYRVGATAAAGAVAIPIEPMPGNHHAAEEETSAPHNTPLRYSSQAGMYGSNARRSLKANKGCRSRQL